MTTFPYKFPEDWYWLVTGPDAGALPIYASGRDIKVSLLDAGAIEAIANGDYTKIASFNELDDAFKAATGRYPTYGTAEGARRNFPPLSPMQIRLALERSGTTLESVDAAIAAIQDPTARLEASIMWASATLFLRTDPVLVSLAASMGFVDERLDALWLWGATL